MFQPRLFALSAPIALFGLALTLVAAAGCTRTVPELDQTRTDALRDAPYPALVPLGPLLATGAAEPDSAERLEREMAWRSARLKSRADRLRAAQPE
ncbi:hypothetical protein [Antarcticimicrobium luteum]|uniref:DUF3035 domain-containing protein n=1 Tax=Antarcticimicrobium luteum TaxID=2547397 RepID=A0A4R5VFX1_9RHOB|nr:hypothetical protein [Antarcticimicrobium luteum]TDK51583.1 hypothetical protein E1832_02995 [Antarcticimicrobium luteum]